MDGLSAFSSVLASTVKIAEKVFEIHAVDEQAKAVLQTVSQVSGQLENAKTLRRQKSSLLTTFEKRMFDENFNHTEEAIREVAALAERARSDMDVSGGKVKVNTRLLFVLHDSPNIHISLTRLSIANQNLNSALMTLSNREGHSTSFLPVVAGGTSSPPLPQGELKPPPTYEESQFLSEGRRRNVQRRKSAISLRHSHSCSSFSSVLPPEGISELPTDQTTCNASEKTIPSVTIVETASTPVEQYAKTFSQPIKIDSTFMPEPRTARGRVRSQRWFEARCQ